MGVKVFGIRKVNKQWGKVAQKLTNGSVKGINKVAITVKRNVGWSGGEPLIPVRTGALRNSWFTIKYTPRGNKARAIRFGYRERYAHYQHDPQQYTDTWTNWVYTRKGSGRNYLRSTVSTMIKQDRIKKIIERNIRKQML